MILDMLNDTDLYVERIESCRRMNSRNPIQMYAIYIKLY
jgi:hypothetical protein